MAITKLTLRVYGILLDEDKRVLLSDEFIRGDYFTKFPGGGLELGEGTAHCLIREFKEETGIIVSIKAHFYTTDFFQPSFLDNDSQIISIYYLVESDEWQKIKVSDKKFDFTVPVGAEAESFRWVPLSHLSTESTITLPIDKIVVQLLARPLL